MLQFLKNIYHLIQAIIAVRQYQNPSQSLTIIGVTGTDGKTTTSTLIYHLLKSSGLKTALISTVAAYIGDQQIDTGFHVTSPDTYQLQQLLRQIVDQGYHYVVLEATSHGLDQHRLYGTHIDMGVLTNITHEHLDYHKTSDRYLAAKAKLFRHSSIAFLNQTDSSYKRIKPLIPDKTKIISYSSNSLEPNLKKVVVAKFPQKYNQLNATAAVLVAKQLKVSDTDLIKSLPKFPGVPGRMESIANKNGVTAIVDFAHTPNALSSVLKSLKKQTSGKLIAVYGSAGLRDRTKRPLMGQIGSQIANEVILTTEDPRTESVWSILDQMSSQITQNVGHVFKIPDRQKAINFAVNIAQKGDTVVVLGKGHEQSMCFGTIEHPWSDKKALIQAFNQKNDQH